MLPFTAEVYLAQVSQYNLAFWPVIALLQVAACAVIFLLVKRSETSARTISLLLALLWLWCGVAFHWLYFTPISFFAPATAALFLVQAALLVWKGGLSTDVRFSPHSAVAGVSGPLAWALVSAALILYPVAGLLFGQSWDELRLVGSAPGATALFTLAVLLLAVPRPPWPLLIVPLLWCAVAGAASWKILALSQDIILVAGAVLTLIVLPRLIFAPRRR